MNHVDPSQGPSEGNSNRAEQLGLTPEVYTQLKQLAYTHLRTYRSGMTLNCTALVHEAFLKLHGNSAGTNKATDENHFMALASLAMRHILVDYARHKKAEKRGSGAFHVTLHEPLIAADTPAVDMLELDMALGKLSKRDPLLEKLVILRFFAGLNTSQVADVLDRSIRSVERDWTRARVYLFRELEPNAR